MHQCFDLAIRGADQPEIAAQELDVSKPPVGFVFQYLEKLGLHFHPHIADFVKQRYASWDSGVGARIEAGKANFKDLEDYILKKGDAAPCVSGCPIHNDIPAYMTKIRAGEVHEAVAILLRTNPLPAVTGRICPHTCETDCNRFGYDEPVSIREVERFLGDYALEHAGDLYRPPATESGKRVGIVGAGPTGLTAAYFLRQAGHDVTVLDQMPAGGEIIGILFTIFIVLLVTDILGFTKVFPFTRSIK